MAKQSELDKFKLYFEDCTDHRPVSEVIKHIKRRRLRPEDIRLPR